MEVEAKKSGNGCEEAEGVTENDVGEEPLSPVGWL